jgi:hypothetical protein
MDREGSLVAAVAIPLGFALLSGCTLPTHDPVKLEWFSVRWNHLTAEKNGISKTWSERSDAI